jgi:hypothetical protein
MRATQALLLEHTAKLCFFLVFVGISVFVRLSPTPSASIPKFIPVLTAQSPLQAYLIFIFERTSGNSWSGTYPPNDFMHTHGYWQSWWCVAAAAFGAAPH